MQYRIATDVENNRLHGEIERLRSDNAALRKELTRIMDLLGKLAPDDFKKSRHRKELIAAEAYYCAEVALHGEKP